MSILNAVLLDPRTVIYLFNLAIAVSFVCGVGLFGGRRCVPPSPGSHAHGILIGTLAIVLLSPGAAWMGQRSGLTWVQVAVSNEAEAARSSGAAAAIKPLPARVFLEGSPSVSARIANVRDGANTRSVGGTERVSALENVLGSRSPPSEGVLEDQHSSLPNSAAWPSVVCSWQFAGTMLAFIWMAGILVQVIRLAWGYRILAGFRRCLEEVAEPRMKALARHAAEAVGRAMRRGSSARRLLRRRCAWE